MLFTAIAVTVGGTGGASSSIFTVYFAICPSYVIVSSWFEFAVLESKPVTIVFSTLTISFVPSDFVTSIVRFVTSKSSPTLYSVLWFVLFTAIAVTVGALSLNFAVKVISLSGIVIVSGFSFFWVSVRVIPVASHASNSLSVGTVAVTVTDSPCFAVAALEVPFVTVILCATSSTLTVKSTSITS